MLNEARYLAYKISKLGYYGGSPDEVLQAPIGTVMGILKFEAMENDFTVCYQQINKDS